MVASRPPASVAAAGGRARPSRRTAVLATLGLGLVATALLALAVGAYGVPPQRTVAIVASHLGIDLGIPFTLEEDAVVWSIRLPRVVLGALVGAALAVSGASLQALFRNPLADPGLVGVASGAALAAVAAIVLGLTAAGTLVLPGLAFAGGLVATLLAYAIARYEGRTEVVTLILTGLAVNALAGAGIGFLLFIADDEELRGAVFWSLGSLATATWEKVAAAAPFIVAGTALTLGFGRTLNLLALGEREAGHLGVRVERARLALIVLCALATGAAVAVAGIVTFIGLIVPHLVRLALGPDNRTVVPASALLGAALLLLADAAARTVSAPAELPLGVVTSLIGGPFFLWLVYSTRRAHGGWG